MIQSIVSATIWSNTYWPNPLSIQAFVRKWEFFSLNISWANTLVVSKWYYI
jgi:hypothetical protein